MISVVDVVNVSIVNKRIIIVSFTIIMILVIGPSKRQTTNINNSIILISFIASRYTLYGIFAKNIVNNKIITGTNNIISEDSKTSKIVSKRIIILATGLMVCIFELAL